MLKMCRPASEKEQLAWMRTGKSTNSASDRCHHTPTALRTLMDYCAQDVRTEHDIARILPEWRSEGLEAFWANEHINDRGLVVDVKFARAAATYAEDEKKYFNARIDTLTNGEVTTPRQFQRIKAWALPRMCAEAVTLTEHYEDSVKKNTLDADARSNLLLRQSTEGDFLTPEVAEFIEILDMAGKSTISKYQAIINRASACSDEALPRVRGLYMFAGAAQSGRFSSTGIQMHNLVRAVPGTATKMIVAFKRGDPARIDTALEEWATATETKTGKPASREAIHALAQLVRPSITGCPDGHFDLAWCDWSSIEARVLPWLTLAPSAESRLEAFRRGEDIYLTTATGILGREITKADEFERQAYGKVPELSLGYLGGEGAFAAMAKNYGVSLPAVRIRDIVRAWREANPWAMAFGQALEMAAIRAIEVPGSHFSAGRIYYHYNPDNLDGIGALFARLPSGRDICYPGARTQVVVTKWGAAKLGITAFKAAWRPKKNATEWPRITLWPGLLSENASQAVATADLLNVAILRLTHDYGLRVVGHTHDEILIETSEPERDSMWLKECMETSPDWPGADALPLKAEAGFGFRYKVKFPEPERMAEHDAQI